MNVEYFKNNSIKKSYNIDGFVGIVAGGVNVSIISSPIQIPRHTVRCSIPLVLLLSLLVFNYKQISTNILLGPPWWIELAAIYEEPTTRLSQPLILSTASAVAGGAIGPCRRWGHICLVLGH